jgi:hypothetical protein
MKESQGAGARSLRRIQFNKMRQCGGGRAGLNAQCGNQQVPGIAPGMGFTEKKTKEKKQPRSAVYCSRCKPSGKKLARS